MQSPPAAALSADEDARLLARCRDGDERAWNRLVDKYNRLVYSVPGRRGLQREECEEIYQAVWVDLFRDLDRLRDDRALAAWLIRVAYHKVLHHQKNRRREEPTDDSGLERAAETAEPPRDLIEQMQRDQAIREALDGLPERCRSLIRLLFYQDPPLPYAEVAGRLGLAIGSIGFIRRRCLSKLEKAIAEAGV